MRINFFGNNPVKFFCAGMVMSVFMAAAAICSAGDLSLYEAVRTALEQNHMLQAEKLGADALEEKIRQARSGVMPQISLSEQVSRTTSPLWAFGSRLNQQAITQQDFDPARLNDPDAISNYATVLSVNWPLYDSGQTWYSIQQARLAGESAFFSVSRKRQAIMAQTAGAYLQTLLSVENEKILHQMMETAVSHEKLISSRYSGGFVAKSDLLRARVRITDLSQQITQAENYTRTFLCLLNTLMGLGPDMMHQLTDTLRSGDPVSGSMEEWTAAARENRPDLREARLMLEIAQKELKKSKSARLPMVGVSSSYEINTEDLDHTGSNYTIGAQVSVPLFTGGRISSKIRESALLVRKSEAMLQAADQKICAETRAAFLTARSAWERTEVAMSAIGQSEESMRIVKNRYQSGLFTITDLLDAQVMLQKSLTDHLKSVHDYLAAVVELTLSAGTAADETQVLKRQP